MCTQPPRLRGASLPLSDAGTGTSAAAGSALLPGGGTLCAACAGTSLGWEVDGAAARCGTGETPFLVLAQIAPPGLAA